MIPFNLYGVMILFPCAGIVFFASSRFEQLVDASGLSEGLWTGIIFLACLTLSSLCASLFDRTDVPGLFPSYRALWRQFYYGERTYPKARVAGFFTPLAVSPCLIIMFTIMCNSLADCDLIKKSQYPANYEDHKEHQEEAFFRKAGFAL